MNPLNVVWIVIVFAVALFEGMAAANRRRGDTISENVWKITSTEVGRYVFWAGWGWLTWHLGFSGGGFGAMDVASIGIGVLIAFLTGLKK